MPATLSGNEITDAVRSARVSGDGLPAPQSMTGIWNSSTNLHQYADESVYAWAPCFSVESNVEDDTAPFDQPCHEAQVFTSVAYANIIRRYDSGVYVSTSAGTVLTLSAWVKWEAGTLPPDVGVGLLGWPTTFTYFAYTNVASLLVLGEWVRVTAVGTVPSGDSITGFHLYHNSSSGYAYTIRVQGIQIENTSGVATPYIPTSSVAVTRNSARVQIPANLLDETQFWIALRARAATAHTFSADYTQYLFSWRDAADTRIEAWVDPSGVAYLQRNSSSGATSTNAAVSYAAGEDHLFVFKGTATTLGAAFDSGAQAIASATQIPTITSTTIDIGRLQTVGGAAGNFTFHWVAGGVGTVTDADVDALYAFGNNDPNPKALSSSMACTFVWPARTAGLIIPGQSVRPFALVGVAAKPIASIARSANASLVNLFTNGGFEDGISEWADSGGAGTFTESQSLEYAHTGTYSMKIVNDTSGNDRFMATNFVVPRPGFYIVKVWAKCTVHTASAYTGRWLFAADASEPIPGYQQTWVNAVTDWVELSVTVEAKADSLLHIRLYCPQGTIYYDDFGVYKQLTSRPVAAVQRLTV